MKLLKTTIEARAYSEEEAKEYIDRFREEAENEVYIVGANGYTYKAKKAKGAIVSEGWLCKCVKIHHEFWGEEDI